MANTNDSSSPGQTLAKLKIPAEHVEAFRAGLLHELEFDGNWIEDQAQEFLRGEDRDRDEVRFGKLSEEERLERNRDPFVCIGGPLREAQHDADVLRQLVAGGLGAELEVTGDAGALMHALEGTARQLSKGLAQTEFGDEEPRRELAAVVWAVDEAKRLEGEAEKRKNGEG